MPSVSFVRKDLKQKIPLYNVINDCLEGEYKIKEAKTKRLPKPNADDDSEANELRYKAYLERAVFYNVTSRTIRGLLGQIFAREPAIEFPSLLVVVEDDATGTGVTITQLSKRLCSYVLAFGRGGCFTDYPQTDEVVSKEQLDKGEIRPIIRIYKPWEVINWRTKQRGAKTILCLVVLVEKYVVFDDGFEIKEDLQYRVLRLGKSAENLEGVEGEDVYTVEIWQKISGDFVIAETYQPKDASGLSINEIPFIFAGSENNDLDIDLPPAYDIASLNIAHYRNSADYEESCFFIGQPTAWFSGLTEEWVGNVLKGVIPLGARGGIPLPENSSAGLLQVEPNSMAFEAMQHKERQMVALGAKLVEQKTVQRTATEANIEESSETSILTSCAKNSSNAIQFCLNWCCRFLGIPENEFTFELNTDFDISTMSSDERSQTIKEWQGGAISFTEMRAVLKKTGIATQEDEEAKKEIDREMESAPKLEDDQFSVGK